MTPVKATPKPAAPEVQLAEAKARVRELTEQIEATTAAEAVGAAPALGDVTSDEGMPCAWLSAQYNLIVNLSTDAYDAKRRELHVNGRAFQHVAETSEGRWIYRYDN